MGAAVKAACAVETGNAFGCAVCLGGGSKPLLLRLYQWFCHNSLL